MIFAHEPKRTRLDDGTVAHSVCTVFKNGKKSISIALDNSCGRLAQLSRSDLRLFTESHIDGDPWDDTFDVFPNEGPGSIQATKENFEKAWEWLNEDA